MRGKQEFVQSLTQRLDYGIEIKERWDVWRIAILIGFLIALSLAVAVGYSVRTGDVSSGFAIAGTCQILLKLGFGQPNSFVLLCRLYDFRIFCQFGFDWCTQLSTILIALYALILSWCISISLSFALPKHSTMV